MTDSEQFIVYTEQLAEAQALTNEIASRRKELLIRMLKTQKTRDVATAVGVTESRICQIAGKEHPRRRVDSGQKVSA